MNRAFAEFLCQQAVSPRISQGDKANSYREFKHTVRNPGGWIYDQWRGEYVCDYGNPDKP